MEHLNPGSELKTPIRFREIRFFFYDFRLSFSFGRALQASCLKAWAGKDVAAGQEELLKRAETNGLAALGQYLGGAAGAAGAQSNFVQKHTY